MIECEYLANCTYNTNLVGVLSSAQKKIHSFINVCIPMYVYVRNRSILKYSKLFDISVFTDELALTLLFKLLQV